MPTVADLPEPPGKTQLSPLLPQLGFYLPLICDVLPSADHARRITATVEVGMPTQVGNLHLSVWQDQPELDGAVLPLLHRLRDSHRKNAPVIRMQVLQEIRFCSWLASGFYRKNPAEPCRPCHGAGSRVKSPTTARSNFPGEVVGRIIDH